MDIALIKKHRKAKLQTQGSNQNNGKAQHQKDERIKLQSTKAYKKNKMRKKTVDNVFKD